MASYGDGRLLAQVEVDVKNHETRVFRRLLRPLDLVNVPVTADVLHTVHANLDWLVTAKQATTSLSSSSTNGSPPPPRAYRWHRTGPGSPAAAVRLAAVLTSAGHACVDEGGDLGVALVAGGAARGRAEERFGDGQVGVQVEQVLDDRAAAMSRGLDQGELQRVRRGQFRSVRSRPQGARDAGSQRAVRAETAAHGVEVPERGVQDQVVDP